MISGHVVQRRLFTGVVVLALLVTASVAGAAGGKGGGGGSRSHDTTAPTVAISAPAAGATVSATVAVSGTASDNVGLARVELSVDGGSYLVVSGTTSWSYALNTTTLSNAAHTLTVRATDTSGNTKSVSETVSVQNATSAPSVSITAPSAGTTVAGNVTVNGKAADSVPVTSVQLSVDGGAYQTASGTTTWSYPLSTTTLSNGAHTLKVRATDTLGTTATASETVSVSNPAPDTTPPTVGISSPAAGAGVSGGVSVSGSAVDNVGVAKVELSVDGGAYQAASGTTSWIYSLDTTMLGNGSHTLTARATDTSGNTSTSSESVTVQNSSTLPPGVVDQMVTPEGATIDIYSDAVGWTAQQVYDLLKPNAYQLDVIGPTLMIDVTSQYASQTTTSASSSNGAWGDYQATITLQANGTSAFATRPDAVMAHEYGHAWTNYYYYVKWQRDWTPYLSERGISGNPLVDSSYQWTTREMIADDYRLLFGTSSAQSEMAYINPDVPDPRTVSGLKDWFVNTWS